MNFTKLQGAGNDFILIETGDMERNWPEIARVLCDRHFGIGADGLLLLAASQIADFRMRIINSDGSEAEACGNGIRCFARYVVDCGLLENPENINIETIAGIRTVWLKSTPEGIVNFRFGMGIPKFKANEIPVNISADTDSIVDINSMLSYPVAVDGWNLQLNFVNMGNPHAVYFLKEPIESFPLVLIGPKIEHLGIFPNRINFEVACVIDRRLIDVVVWERGAGETLACGTGACAVAVAAYLHGYAEREIDIKLPGGTLQVEWDRGGEVFLCGPVEKVFTGEWPD